MVEPLRELFKDEVRRVGEYLNVPTEILSRQSFPSSGLALRILGDVTPARLQTLRAADLIFTEEIAAAGLNKRLWQYFACWARARRRYPRDHRPARHAVAAIRRSWRTRRGCPLTCWSA